MDNDLLNGIILSYSSLLKEIEGLREDINTLTKKIQNNYVAIQTPQSLPPSIVEEKTKTTNQKQKTEVKEHKGSVHCKYRGVNIMQMLEKETD